MNDSGDRAQSRNAEQKRQFEAKLDEAIGKALTFHPNPKNDPKDFGFWASAVDKLFNIKGRLNPAFAQNSTGADDAADKEVAAKLNGKTGVLAMRWAKEAQKELRKVGGDE